VACELDEFDERTFVTGTSRKVDYVDLGCCAGAGDCVGVADCIGAVDYCGRNFALVDYDGVEDHALILVDFAVFVLCHDYLWIHHDLQVPFDSTLSRFY
jgi:hypothetical protein